MAGSLLVVTCKALKTIQNICVMLGKILMRLAICGQCAQTALGRHQVQQIRPVIGFCFTVLRLRLAHIRFQAWRP